ncbi:MAG: hypothetical protein JST88_06975 [Bacteroidetes bacterium]|nr:hypothetical protein [Bacteroidota bacterium]
MARFLSMIKLITDFGHFIQKIRNKYFSMIHFRTLSSIFGTMRFLFTSLLLIFSTLSFAQNKVKEQAKQMANALLQKDYASYINYTYPSIVKEMGGREKMISAIENQMKSMEPTAQILSIDFGQPSSVIQEREELQCTIPQQMVLQTPQGKVQTQSTLIGISKDEGNHWYFVDIGDRDLNAVRTSLPNISRKLILPKPEPPQFVK